MAEVRGPAIGIDLGTTYSRVAVWQHGRVKIIKNDQGKGFTPSYVAFTDTKRLIGDAAKEQLAENPKNTIFGKRFLLHSHRDLHVFQVDCLFMPRLWDEIFGVSLFLSFFLTFFLFVLI